MHYFVASLRVRLRADLGVTAIKTAVKAVLIGYMTARPSRKKSRKKRESSKKLFNRLSRFRLVRQTFKNRHTTNVLLAFFESGSRRYK